MGTHTILFLLAVGLVWSTQASADTEAALPYTSCGTTMVPQQGVTGGWYVTSFGTIKALMIFIDFPDDNNHPNDQPWRVGVGPNFLNSIIDGAEQPSSGTYANVSTFFKDMSFNQFRMIGTAHYVQAPYPLSWYVTNHPGAECSYSARDAIQILDGTMDFSDYDRWIDSPNSHTPGTDHVLDWVFICYRDWYLNQGNGGSSFGYEGWWGASLPNGSVSVDGGARSITSAHSVDVLRMMQYPRFEHMVHELGHALGLTHQYGQGMWSLMGHKSPNISSFMNCYERAQLGWTSIIDQTVSDTKTLQDFGTSGVAYRVSLGSNEYLLLENHQMLSQYDLVDARSNTPGLYVLQQASGAANPDLGNLRVVPADGRWNWSTPQWIIFPGTDRTVPVFKHASVSRNTGRSDRDRIYAVYQGQGDYYAVLAWINDGESQVNTGPRNKGDGKDAFNLTNNDLISPKSNPSACTVSGVESNNAVRFVSHNGTAIVLQFYIGDPLAAPPAKPQFLQVFVVGPTGNNRPQLTWTANTESDMASYKIYRAWGVGGTYGNLATVSHPTTSWIDYSIHPGNYDTAYYKIKARDNTGLESIYSNPVWIKSDVQRKIGVSPDETVQQQKPAEFALHQNYPNPLNPSTTIDYELPTDIYVSLSVHDILGREVATLAKGYQKAGLHSVVWDGSSVSSGAYYVRIVASDGVGSVRFSRTNKIVLMK